MRGLQKSKRVSWASDISLCQVRLFLSEESPSQVGLGAQDHLQAKLLWPLHSTGMGSDDNLPPGFEGTHPANLLENKLAQIPLIKWRCPPRFVLDFMWQVVAGEESKEVEIQNQREMRVLEAVYPRPSAIPPNPSVLIGAEDSYRNDQHIPQIPITPAEDEDTAADTSFDSMAPNSVPMSSQPQLWSPGTSALQCSATTDLNPLANGIPAAGMVHGIEPDVVMAAYAALTALTTSNDRGNLIDRDLLVKILSDPKLMEKLVTSHGEAIKPQITLKPRSSGITLSDPPQVHVENTEAVASLSAASPSNPFYPLPSSVGPVPNLRPLPPEVVSAPSQPVGSSVAKDINYYKSLIQQHGGERQETLGQFGSQQNHHLGVNQEPVNNPKSRDLKPKIMKPCIYFNSSRGCRHGANCVYQHDASSQQRGMVSSMAGVQSAKRMKMDREIPGS